MIRSHLLRLTAATALLFVSGCQRERIRVYVVAPDAPRNHDHEHDHADTAKTGATAEKPDEPQIAWQLPEGWRETEASSVNFANFVVPSATGGEATASIAQLPNLQGREPFVVNMWREQVGLGPVPEDEAAKAFAPTIVAGSGGLTFEVSGTREGKPIRIVTALLHRPEGSWFFKLSGDEATVLAHKAEFLNFAKTIRFVGNAPAQVAAPAPAAGAASPPASAPAEGAAPNFKWAVPEGWKTLPPGQMQVAKFSVPEKDGAKAEVAVSIFPSETGGTLSNVNRWRAQLGMEATDEAGLKDCTQPLEGGAVLVDLAKEQRQLVGAIVPRDGRWWFYKKLGDAPAVASAKEAFVQFVKTAP